MKFSIHFAWGWGLAALLAGCGGGGGEPQTTPPTTTTVSGVALNSYLENATVFLDVNGDGVLNNGEPSTTTNANGAFSFPTTESLNGRLLLVKATTATKMDGVLLSQGMTLMTPAEKPAVVSPLTTEVVAKMKANPNWSIADAQSAVQSELGLDPSLDVMKDYIKEKSNNNAYAQVQNVSSVVSALLKTVEAQSSSNTSTSERLASLSTEISTKLLPIVSDVKTAADVTAAKAKLEARIQELANNSGNVFKKPSAAPNCVTSANAIWLTDYVNNVASSGCLTVSYSDGILNIANTTFPLNIANVQALRKGTSTNTPIASVILNALPTLASPLSSKLEIQLSKENSPSTISTTLEIEIVQIDQEIVIRSQAKEFDVNIILTKDPISNKTAFSNTDVIARTSIDAQGMVVLNFNVLGLITKLGTSKTLNDMLSAYEILKSTTYPTAGNYKIAIKKPSTVFGDWPFKTFNNQVINGIVIDLPIQ